MNSKADLAQSIDGFFEAMLASVDKENRESDLYKLLMLNPDLLNIAKIRRNHSVLFYPALQVFSAAIQDANNLDRNAGNKIADIFLNYHFYSSNIEALCTVFESSACCADKSNVIINQYLIFLKKGELPCWDIENEKCYWLPRFGSQSQWMDLMDGLFNLRYGKNVNYLNAYQALHSAGMDKYGSN